MKKLVLRFLDFLCRLANGGKGLFALRRECEQQSEQIASLRERCADKQEEILVEHNRVRDLLKDCEEARSIATRLQGVSLELEAALVDRDWAAMVTQEQRRRADREHAAKVMAELRTGQMTVYWQQAVERAEQAEAVNNRFCKMVEELVRLARLGMWIAPSQIAYAAALVKDGHSAERFVFPTNLHYEPPKVLAAAATSATN